jgi:Txe/YoeB family toxin of Txe-Axe toxin-antitoxin module
MVLHDIREHMISYSISPKFETKEEEKRYLPIETFRDDSKMTIAKENTGFSQPSLINMSQNNLAPYYSDNQVEDNLLKQLTLQALNEKMPDLINEVKKDTKENIFKPVESQPLKPNMVDTNSINNQLQAANLFGAVNSQQLSNLLAENLMSLLNNAMLHINTSLSKGLPQVLQVPQVHQQTMQNIQTLTNKTDPNPMAATKKPEDVVIEDENPRDYPSNRKISPFKKNLLIDIADEERETVPKSYNITRELIDPKQETLLDKLEREEREIQMEKQLLRQQKPFVTSTSSKAMTGDMGDFFKSNFYFVNHEPKPIANLSEYYKELQSDLSSSGDQYQNSISIPQESRRDPRMMESMASRSEGQIFGGFDSQGHEQDVPKFGRRASRQSHDAYSEASQLDTPGKCLYFY